MPPKPADEIALFKEDGMSFYMHNHDVLDRSVLPSALLCIRLRTYINREYAKLRGEKERAERLTSDYKDFLRGMKRGAEEMGHSDRAEIISIFI